jgi:hypothetical protein
MLLLLLLLLLLPFLNHHCALIAALSGTYQLRVAFHDASQQLLTHTHFVRSQRSRLNLLVALLLLLLLTADACSDGFQLPV